MKLVAKHKEDEMKISSRIAVLAGSLLLSSASSSFAAAQDYDAIYSKCLKDAGGANNSSVFSCAEDTTVVIKKEMNRLYDQIHKTISEASKEDAQKFETSQKAWLSYRNTQCELATTYVGSPMEAYCPMQLNIARVKELRVLAGEE